MKKNILFVLLVGYVQLITAQNIKGTVLDNNHKALPYVTVRLLNTDSTFVQGTHTDSLGVYSMSLKQQGNYLLCLSSIGYKTQVLPVEVQRNKQLSVIILETDNVVLNEITIEASSFVRQDDKISIYPDKKQIKHSATGYDLLYKLMIPEVDVDRMEGKVSTLGGEATLYIDGRKVDSQEIRSLNPKEIEKVEYYDVPAGKYMNDVAAINFITKKYKTGGYVSLNAEQRIGYLSGDYNAVAKLSHNNTSYTLFAGHSMSKYDGTKDETQEHFVFSDHETDRQSGTLESRVKNNSQYAQLNMTNQNDKRTLIGKLSLVRNDAPNNYAQNMLEYGGTGIRQESFKNTDQSGLKSAIELYGYFHLNDKQFLEMTLGGNYTDNTYAYTYRENSYSTSTDSKEDLYDLSINVNYGIQFKHRNSLTVQTFHFQTISSVNYRGNNPSWQHFWNEESILFLEYNQKLGPKFTLKLGPGASYVQYRLHGDERKDEFSPRLRSSLIYCPSKNQQIQLRYHVGNSELQINQLNEVEQQIDSLQIRRGNPNQKIAFLYKLIAVYSGQFGKFNIGAELWYDGINHVPAEDFYIENDKLIRSYESEGKRRMFTSQLSGAWKVTDNLRIKLVGNWLYIKPKATPEKLRCFSGNMQVDYYWNDFSCGVFAKSRTKSLNYNLMYVTGPAQYGGYISWNHNNWHIESGSMNPFTEHNKRESVMDRGVYSYKNVATSKLYRQSGYVKVTYTFDFGKKTHRENNDVDTNINSTILKAD
ncbi:TonB-dependent receptor [uncultured Bacteroides sp.]|uniref:TonB-dependent receptor n=1 Tax=uncultured Bacteroides sp. TaxID=162156 RepID=UPI002AA8D5EB|nr:TonB-dependent receptor [uncultured Bacteroides sp.]